MLSLSKNHACELCSARSSGGAYHNQQTRDCHHGLRSSHPLHERKAVHRAKEEAPNKPSLANRIADRAGEVK